MNKEFIGRAFDKAIADLIKEDNSQNDKKLIYWGIRYLPIADESVEMKEKIISLIELLMKGITYREFMNLFPIAKEYDGGDDWKDYYYTIDYLKDFDLDSLIDNPLELLMEYNNHDIMFFNVEFMEVTSELSKEHLGIDPFIEFFYPEQYPRDSKGNVIGITADGKVHKMASPEKPILKIVK